MKAKIEFDLNNEDDKMAYKRANKSLEMALVLWDIKYRLRKELEDCKDVDKVFYNIFDLMDYHGVNLDDLIE